jgi:hypothetical protein
MTFPPSKIDGGAPGESGALLALLNAREMERNSRFLTRLEKAAGFGMTLVAAGCRWLFLTLNALEKTVA